MKNLITDFARKIAEQYDRNGPIMQEINGCNVWSFGRPEVPYLCIEIISGKITINIKISDL
jgi:hypothetical protein